MYLKLTDDGEVYTMPKPTKKVLEEAVDDGFRILDCRDPESPRIYEDGEWRDIEAEELEDEEEDDDND